jgi:hypothetical protein
MYKWSHPLPNGGIGDFALFHILHTFSCKGQMLILNWTIHFSFALTCNKARAATALEKLGDSCLR